MTLAPVRRKAASPTSPIPMVSASDLSHIGIWPEDMTASIAALRQRGVKVDDPRTGSTKSSITNVTDPNGVRLRSEPHWHLAGRHDRINSRPAAAGSQGG